MQGTNPISPVNPPAPVAAAKPADSARNTFANLLSKSRSMQPAPPETRAQGGDAEAADAPAAPSAPPKARLKTADKPGPKHPAEREPKAAGKPESKPQAQPEDSAGKARAKVNDAPVADPAVAPWLVAANHTLPVDSEAESDTATALAGDSKAGAKADDTVALQDRAATDLKARLESAAASREALAQWASSTRADGASTQRFGQTLVADEHSLKIGSTENSPTAAVLGAAAFNPLLGARENAAPLSVNLPTPMASPEFAQALGVQMSVLASDGVERAELQLNPAEMGPVSVQIVIEGKSARVDFGADLAATRHAIEAGLPQLASALSDAGFTLTGGGVSQHSGGRNAPPDATGHTGHNQRRDADGGDDTPPRAVQRHAVTAGGVDLYA